MQEDLDRSRDGKTGVEHNRRRQMQLSRICRGTNQQKAKKISIDPPGVEKLSRRQELSQSIHQVSRSGRDCNKKKLKKLDRQQGIEEVLSQLFKIVFREEKNTDMNAIKHATQPMIQSTSSLDISQNQLSTIIFKHMDLKNTHTH